MALQMMSSAFQSGERIPDRHTCEGPNVSPPLTWRGAPDGTASFAIIADDPDAPNGVFAHWILYNIPGDADLLPEHLPEGEQPDGSLQGRNDFGNTMYEGPCPPQGSEHQYFFRLYALDSMLDLSAGATRPQVLERIQPHILEHTEIQGRFGRSMPG